MKFARKFIIKGSTGKNIASPADQILDAILSDTEEMSPEEYLDYMKENASEVDSVRFVPPSLSSRSFGSFKVKFHKPRLVTR